jgi:two-component system sensor histidine kinase/response regulator
MDGYEATRQIRATPALAGQCVIAMTANAMAEDRERCLESGMDDFVTKPIDADHLYQTLAKWLPDTKPVIKPQHEETNTQMAIETNPIDLSVLSKLLKDNPVKIAKFAQKFADTSREALAEMQSAYESNDLALISRLCHKQKSAAASVGARSSAALYSSLEEAAGIANDKEIVRHLLIQLSLLLDQIFLQLQKQEGGATWAR